MIVDTAGEAIQQAWRAVLSDTTPVAPRGMATYEYTNFHVTILDPTRLCYAVKGRDLVPWIGLFEGLQLVGQTSDPDASERVKGLAQFRNDGTFDGAYGVRIQGQLARVVALLADDPDTRQAVLTIHHTPTDLPRITRDNPCTLSIQFLRRREMLHMTVTMRSNDVWLGLPYDLMQFQMLQAAVAAALGVPVGAYHHQVASLHAYERNHAAIVELHVDGRFHADHVDIAWGGDDIGAISRRARDLLYGRGPLDDMTMFETMCRRQMK